jgi:hypothetical protein
MIIKARTIQWEEILRAGQIGRGITRAERLSFFVRRFAR